MAQVFSAPASIAPPVIDYRNDDTGEKAENEYIAAIADYCKARRPAADGIGEVVRFPVADGYALYMVASLEPAELIHIPLGDGWSIPDAHLRGITADDLVSRIEAGRALRKLFQA